MQEFRDWLLRYGIILGKRHTKKQRLDFLRSAQKEFAEMGYDVDVTHSELKAFQGAKEDYYNLYAGHPKQADVIVATYYDTPVKSFGAYRYHAFQQSVPRVSMLINLLPPLLMLILSGCLLYFVNFRELSELGFYNIWGVLTLLVLIGALLFITRTRGGIPNRYNMVRNTSSVIVSFQLASALSDGEKKKTAFVFLDGVTSSNYAFEMLKNYVGKLEGRKLVYLDSIGNPGNIQVFTRDASLSPPKGAEIHRKMPENAIIGDYLVTAGNYENGAVPIPRANSRSDSDLEEKNIKNGVQALKDLLDQIEAEEPPADAAPRHGRRGRATT